VSVSGVVTTSWGVPLVPFRFYNVDDGTGELTVISQNSRTPANGEKVRVKGRVEDVPSSEDDRSASTCAKRTSTSSADASVEADGLPAPTSRVC
jgi:hypothetical protein